MTGLRVPLQDMMADDPAEGCGQPETVRRRWPAWPLVVSVLLHAAVGMACIVVLVSSPPPAPLPQIDLLPPAPTPPIPEEAAPSPEKAPIKPLPAYQKAAPPPVPQRLHSLRTSNETAERALPKPSPDPVRQSDSQTPPTIDDSFTEAASIPVSGAKSAANTIFGKSAQAAHQAGPPPDYIGLIRARLDKAKHYPDAARAAGQEGTVLLHFVLERTGAVTQWKITQSSGVSSLDDEVSGMLTRVTFPPFPSSLDQDSLSLTVPVEFSLKKLDPG